jgi:predicted lipid-binding transport protein (Tim44 family)
MGDGAYFLDILIFAMVAAFLVYRLRSVLGRRTGEERQRPNPLAQRGAQAPGKGPREVEPGPAAAGPLVDAAAPSDEPLSVNDGIARIRGADPSFDADHFLNGAGAAFAMIVEAYAKGDTATLRPLLADDVYDHFAADIRRRNAEGETLESRLDGVEADIVEARLDGRTALVTVRFHSRQGNVVRNRAGEVVDGEPGHVAEVEDIWTFSRNTRATDPNWKLVETHTPH